MYTPYIQFKKSSVAPKRQTTHHIGKNLKSEERLSGLVALNDDSSAIGL
jgi:hypothetical protein